MELLIGFVVIVWFLYLQYSKSRPVNVLPSERVYNVGSTTTSSASDKVQNSGHGPDLDQKVYKSTPEFLDRKGKPPKNCRIRNCISRKKFELNIFLN